MDSKQKNLVLDYLMRAQQTPAGFAADLRRVIDPGWILSRGNGVAQGATPDQDEGAPQAVERIAHV